MAIDAGHPPPSLPPEGTVDGASDSSTYDPWDFVHWVDWSGKGYPGGTGPLAGVVTFGEAYSETYQQHIAVFYITHEPGASFLDCPW